MQPHGPGGIPPTHARPVQQAPKKSGGGGTVLLLVGGLGCLGLLSATCIIGAGFWLAAEQEKEAALYGPAGLDEGYGDYGQYDPYGGAGVGGAGGPVVPAVGGGAAATGVERYRVPVTADNATRGPSDALVTIVEFGDFQCPFCARATATMEQLEREYPGDVRFVFKHNPLAFHTDAEPAAHAALEAREQQGDDAFWRLHDRFFENTRALSRSDIERYARQEGLNVAAIRRAMDTSEHSGVIAADQALARQIGATGTPTFFINGRELAGAQPVESFRAIVDEELRTARQMVAQGTPRSQIYDALLRDARTSPAPEPSAAVGARPTDAEDPNQVHRVPLGDSPQLGPDDALVTVVVFSDFQCPFCSRVTSTLDQVRERYGDDVRLVFKHNPLPFHQRAMPAAQAAVEVQRTQGDEAFWRLHDVLFENQRSLEDADLQRYARQVGASGGGVARAVRQDAHRARIQQDMDLAASIGARGTPTFFINGKKLRGAQPLTAFEQLIDQELAAARARVASGTPRPQVYDRIIAEAR